MWDIFSWNECESVVLGYPGAEYKGFATETEANAYLIDEQETIGDYNTKEITDKKLHAYVDGSFDESMENMLLGVLLLLQMEILLKSMEMVIILNQWQYVMWQEKC